jgi:hypothetical protein
MAERHHNPDRSPAPTFSRRSSDLKAMKRETYSDFHLSVAEPVECCDPAQLW